jgi:hypothetical protein
MLMPQKITTMKDLKMAVSPVISPLLTATILTNLPQVKEVKGVKEDIHPTRRTISSSPT